MRCAMLRWHRPACCAGIARQLSSIDTILVVGRGHCELYAIYQAALGLGSMR